MPEARILFGDCREQLRRVEPDSVDLRLGNTFTSFSPPGAC